MVSPCLLLESARYSPESAPDFNRRPVLNQFLASLMGARHAGYYFLLYSYLKWVDDQVDAPDAHPGRVLIFLDSQRDLLSGRRDALLPQEKLGAAAGRFTRTDAGRPLYYSLRRLFNSFYEDVHRRNRILHYHELMRRVGQVGESTLDMCMYLFSSGTRAPRTPLTPSFRRDAAMVSVYLDMLLDIPADISAGYINIPREIFELYDMSPEAALRGDFAPLRNHPGLRSWIRGGAGRLHASFKRLEEEIRSIQDRPLRCFLTRLLRSRARKLTALKARWEIQ